ncbi:MAG: hypothetical protein HC896_06585 [Bacteroidales bacterium]|nr:hypothetical protein [Bacteroidales bacterium]
MIFGKRREAHFRDMVDLPVTGHSTNYNTNQYMMWLSYYQVMRWQWNIGEQAWHQDLFALIGHIGGQQGETIMELFKRVIALEYIQKYEEFDSITRPSEHLWEIEHWQRWGNTGDYVDDYGFTLWANISNDTLLAAGKENMDIAVKLLEALKNEGTSPLFKEHIYPVLNYTLDYYALRIHLGLAMASIAKYQKYGQAAEKESAIAHIEKALQHKKGYDEKLKLVSNTCEDFIINPSEERLGRMKICCNKMIPPGWALFNLMNGVGTAIIFLRCCNKMI